MIREKDCRGMTKDLEISWKKEAMLALVHTGYKKNRILDFILENRNQDTDFLIMTQNEMAKRCETSKPTVGQTIRVLLRANLIKRNKGAFKIIFPSP